MLTDKNKRADVLTKQLEIYWMNFDRRRSYEWKLSFAIWATLAAFIALALKGEIRASFLTQLILGFAAFGVLALQTFFQIRVKLANDVDKRKAECYEEKLNDAVEVKFNKTAVKQAIDRVKPWDGRWSLFVHVGITMLLIVGAASVLHANTMKDDSANVPPQQARAENGENRPTTHAETDWATIGVFIATAVLALLTGCYVILTHKLMRAQTDPCVIVSVCSDESRPSILQLVIKNIGRVLARDVRFTLSEPIPCRAFGLDPATAKEPERMNSGPLIDGIPALGPGESRKIVWGQYAGLVKGLGDRKVFVTCKFRRGKRGIKPVECVLDVKSFEGTDAVDPDGARQCAIELRKIAKKLGT